MRYILLCLFTLCSLMVQSQIKRGNIEATVLEMNSQEPIPFASVKLMTAQDSTLVEGSSTDEEGKFKISSPIGKYILEVSFIGYKKHSFELELTSTKTNIKLDSIYLKEDAILLGQAEIVADIPPVQVKGDTIEYNAGSYTSDGSAVLKDLIKKIPGLEVDEEGEVKANGKTISKILVDGKEYFGNDIGMALTTLPANMITKLQLFKEESEKAKATGIKDQDPAHVLNLAVKEEFKRSVFGDVKSGVGNKGKHTNRFNVNKMHGANQYSLTGNINNINDSEYKSFSNFDDNISKSIGANFNIQKSEKLQINGSARYNNNKSIDESRRDSYTSILNQFNEGNSYGVSRRENMSVNATVDWKPDSLTTIYLRTNLGYSENSNSTLSADSASIVNKSSTSSNTNRMSKGDGLRISNALMISRRLNNKGRSITVNLGQSMSDDNNKGTNYSEKTYWGDNTLEIIDQLSKRDSKNGNYQTSVSYVEPLGKDNRIHISYSANFTDSEILGDVRKKDPFTNIHSIIDSAYSRNTESNSVRQSIRMGFQRTKEKYDYSIGLNIDPSYTHNKTYLVDSIIEDLKQNVINYSPSLRLGLNPDKNTSIDFDYTGHTNHPYIAQLSADTVIYSSMSKSVGNPNLKPSFDNQFSVGFRKSDYESGRFVSASASYTYTLNSATSYQLVDDHSNTINSYRNVDGNSNAYMYVTYNTPLRNKKINVGANFNVYYNKNIGFINQKKNIQNRVSITPSLYGRFNSEKVETSLRVNVNHSMAHNNLSEIKTSSNTDYRATNSFKIKLPLDFAVESDISFTHRSGLGENVQKNETMWNLAASKQLLKDKRGTLKFEFFDVLNDLRKEQNYISGSDYNNSWRRAINNYFVFSFAYRFNITQGANKNKL